MAKPSYYKGSRVALLTQHGKERVIAPVLEPGLGCSIELVTGFDTDQFGTFTRETPRNGTQLEAARRKARKGMELARASQGIASEGSFGPDPHTGMFPWNVELLVWIDDHMGIEVVGVAQGAAPNDHIQSGDWQAVADFAERVGFPEHHLVLRPDGQNDKRICKDIADWTRLKTCFDSSLAQSRCGTVFVEIGFARLRQSQPHEIHRAGCRRSAAAPAIDPPRMPCPWLLDQRTATGTALRIESVANS